MNLSTELTAERFSQIVGPLRSDGLPDDKRRQPRAEMKTRATILPLAGLNGPVTFDVVVRDLSPAGIGFVHNECLSLDDEFALLLPRAGDTPAVVLCSVVFWQPLARDLYAIGARFVRVLHDATTPLPITIQEQPTVATDEAARSRRMAS